MSNYSTKFLILTAIQVPGPQDEPSDELIELIDHMDWTGDDSGVDMDEQGFAHPTDWIIRTNTGRYFAVMDSIFKELFYSC